MSESEPVSSISLVLLSGAVGAILATVVQAVFSFWIERVKAKAEVLWLTVDWADESYVRLIDLHVAKRSQYTDGKQYLPPDEYDLNSRVLRSLLIKSQVMARIAAAYGEGEELSLANSLRSILLEATRILWAAKRDTWAATDAQIQRLFDKQIDPLRSQLERRLLSQGSFPMIFLGLKRAATSIPKRLTVQPTKAGAPE